MIFPAQTIPDAAAQERELPLYTDWAYDFDARRLLLRGGKPYMITGRDALQFWIFHALSAARYSFAGYGRDFGQEFATVTGETRWDVICANLERLIRDALHINPYILDMRDFAFAREGNTAIARCVAVTVYGDIPATTEVSVWEY